MNLAHDLATLPDLSVAQLQSRYAEVFGEPTNAGHKGWLVKRIAWRLQANAEGDLSERARQRAAQLANDADLRLSPPKPPTSFASAAVPTSDGIVAPGSAPAAADRRLPQPGAVSRDIIVLGGKTYEQVIQDKRLTALEQSLNEQPLETPWRLAS
jgi:hypothetical protein